MTKNQTSGGPATILPFRGREVTPDSGNIPAMSEAMIERLSDLWVEVLLEDLKRHPLKTPMPKAS